MPDSLYIAWRSEQGSTGHWGPVGRLDRTPSGYLFRYTRGARSFHDFRPFPGMNDLGSVYESEGLFPFLGNRLLARSRPEYARYLEWSGLRSAQAPDPLAVLSVTEGRRETDSFEVFACPRPDAEGRFACTFFVHGIRHLPEDVKDRLLEMEVGDPLVPHFESDNPRDPRAVSLRSAVRPDQHLGYVPRYLAADVRRLAESGAHDIEARVERVNRDAPVQQRLLCHLTAPWPAGFAPCVGEDFEPLALTIL